MEAMNFEKSHIDPLFESLFERIYPARVSVHNDACEHCTVVKVDSANKHGILLEMVQALSDLDLLIPRSYICSDGGWFMDVFHVTDQCGKKITDESVVLCIKEVLCATRWKSKETVLLSPGKELVPAQVSTKGTALEITTFDKPGILSEVSAVLADLGCHVTSAVAWTHNARAACIIYVEEKNKGGPITDLACLTNIQVQMQNVVKAHHEIGEKWSVRLITQSTGEMHTERRLHQLMLGDVNYDTCQGCGGSVGGHFDEHANSFHGKNCYCTLVSIETCKEKGYSVVNVRSRDRPKLLFDTVCALTDMDYDVFHASIRSALSVAFQEYYIRHRDGNISISEDKRHRVVHCLIAAVERRASQASLLFATTVFIKQNLNPNYNGLQLNISATNRTGLLSDVTRVLRECGLSVSKVEVNLKGEKAIGTFYVRGASGQKVNYMEIVKMMKTEINATVQVATKLPNTSLPTTSTSRSTDNKIEERHAFFSIGGLIWSQIESLSSSFIPIRL
ncbi:hypothetical protein V2J09_021609 [Rumex salicifolius]